MKRWIPIGIIFAVILFVVYPLLGVRFIPTHDGEYHIIRFAEFFQMLKAGYLFPRWAPNLNSGYGIPLFNFHYPLPNYIGSLFHVMGASFVSSFKYTLAFGYAVSVLACFFWLKKIFSNHAATIATIIFSFIPYWFVEIFVRGTVGEVLAIMWVMLAFCAIEYRRPVLLSFFLALTILTHNILAMLFFPVLFLYILFRQRSLIWTMLVACFLSAYFWLPALVERQYVTGLNIVNFKDHFPMIQQLLFPSWGTGFSVSQLTSDEMSFQIGVVPMLVIILAIFVRKKLAQSVSHVSTMFLILFFVIFYCMLANSLWLWDMTPFLPLIQYPWRLLVFLLPIVAFLSAIIVTYVKRAISIGICIMAIIVAFSYTRPVTYEPRTDAYYLTRTEFVDGTSSMGNTFGTRWSGWKQIRPKEKIEFIEGSGSYKTLLTKPLHYRFSFLSSSQSLIRANILYYPGWTVNIDGTRAMIDYKTDGAIVFDLPSGDHVVDIVFEETTLRIIADVLSLISLLWLLGSGILKIIYAYRHQHVASYKRA